MMDRWMEKMESMRRNKVAAKQGWKDIITDVIIIIHKKGGGGIEGAHGFIC